jgi:alcohol dehydrogenase
VPGWATLKDGPAASGAEAPGAFADAIALAQPGGRVVVAGTRGGGGAPGFEPDLLVFKELRIFGSLGVDYPAPQSAIKLLVSGRWHFDELSREVTGFSGLPRLLDVLAGNEPERIPALHSVFVPIA